jgi:hypothetical protein
MITYGLKDYWLGDLVSTSEGTGWMVIGAFFTACGHTMTEGYFYDIEGHVFVFQQEKSQVRMETVSGHATHQITTTSTCFVTGRNPLTSLHESVIFQTPTLRYQA